MTTILSEGDFFPPSYRLNRKLSQNRCWQSWVCTNEQTGERNFVRVSHTDGPVDWPSQIKSIDSIQGLVHRNINLAHSHGQEGNLYFVIEPYLTGTKQFKTAPEDPWPILKQLLDVLIYVQQLGLCHGNIHPGNLLIEGKADLQITGMGLHSCRPEEYRQYMSPQILSGDEADITDDIYALGCLIYNCLTGQTLGSGVQPDTPVPEDLQPLLERMTSESVLDRNLSLLDIKEKFKAYYEDSENRITIETFARSEQSKTQVSQDSQVLTRQSRAVSFQWVSFALITLLSIGFGLFTILPEDNYTDQTPASLETSPDLVKATAKSPDSTSPGETGPAPFQAARLKHLREEGQTVARNILRLQLNLEDHGVFLWANEKFINLSQDLDKADSLFREGDYETAMATYSETQDALTVLQSEIPKRLAQEVAKGDAAIKTGDYSVALNAFTISSAIAPTDPDIKAKLLRAENLEEVQSLVRRAELAESEAKYSAALEIFKTARDIDGLWQPAVEGVNRTMRAIQMQQFQNAMSEAFKAISLKQYQAARDHFIKAQSILPKSQEPADGLAQVDQSETNEVINKKRDEANAYLMEEDWQQAISSYEAALAISASLDFAKQGLAYANSRLDLEKQLTKYLSEPTLLQSNEDLAAAANILKDASRISPAGVALERQINSLAKLISTARIQIPVTIRSNGKTSITVRKQASLGNIDAKTIFLIPGKYTITGERPGYRDVREELLLIAGRPVPEIFVASTERVH